MVGEPPPKKIIIQCHNRGCHECDTSSAFNRLRGCDATSTVDLMKADVNWRLITEVMCHVIIHHAH